MITVRHPESTTDFEKYYDLRWRVLRAPWDQPRGSERDEFEERAEHVMAHDTNGRLLGIGRFHLTSEREGQIRYMAVEPDARGSGVGRAIAERLESIAKSRRVQRIVLNAREEAVGFYERLGYAVQGPGPTLFGNLQHYVMSRLL